MSDALLTQLAFTLHATKGVYAVLLGAGASMGAQMPTAWQIVLDLIRKEAGAPLNDATDVEVEEWYAQTKGKAAEYSDVVTSSAPTPETQRALLTSYFEPTPTQRANEQKVPSAAHQALAQLAKAGHVRLFITTNFDRLIEQALDDAHVAYTVVSEAAELPSAPSLMHGGVQILKLHGDYRRANVRNSAADLANYPADLAQHLTEVVRHFGLIMCGWSANYDVALRNAIKAHGTTRYPGVYVSPGAPSPAAQEVIERLRALVFADTADGFFPRLQRRVQALDEHTYVPPLTLAAIEGEIRQALRHPNEAQQRLQDLLDGLADQLHDQLTGDTLPWMSVNPGDRSVACEITKPLLHAIGTLTKYDPQGLYHDVLRDALERVDFDPKEPHGGFMSAGFGVHALPAALLVLGAASVMISQQNVQYFGAVLSVRKYHREFERTELVSLVSRLGAAQEAFDQGGGFKQLSTYLRRSTAEVMAPFLNPRTVELDLDLAELVVLYAQAADELKPGSVLTLDARLVLAGDYLTRVQGPLVHRRLSQVFPRGERRLATLLNVEGISVLDSPVFQLAQRMKSLPNISPEGFVGRMAHSLGGSC